MPRSSTAGTQGRTRAANPSISSRDTVLRPGLSAWSREAMEGFAALVRPWVPAVELRGI